MGRSPARPSVVVHMISTRLEIVNYGNIKYHGLLWNPKKTHLWTLTGRPDHEANVHTLGGRLDPEEVVQIWTAEGLTYSQHVI